MVNPGELGVDFSFTKPPPALLLTKGYTYVVGYLTEPPSDVGKRLLNPLDYVNAGLGVLLVWEQSATEANKGYDEGRRDGADARRDASALGYPVHIPILAACDTNTTAANAQTQVAYMKGFHETCGTMGIYGDVDILRATTGYWSIGWLPNAWSWSGSSRADAVAKGRAAGVHVYQSTGFYIDGLYPVDPNRADIAFPAWGREDEEVKDIMFQDGSGTIWRLMEDGSKRGVQWPEEYDMRIAAGAVLQTKTTAQTARIPNWVAPTGGGSAPPYPTKFAGNIKDNGVVTGTVTV